MSDKDSPLFPQTIMPPNAVMVTATMAIAVGALTRTYTTQLMIQTGKPDEITWAIDEAWKATRAKEKADAAAAAPPGK